MHQSMRVFGKQYEVMRSVKEIITNPLVSPWRGSQTTYMDVKKQIRSRWGDVVAEGYSPVTDVMPYHSWISAGLNVKRGEKSLKSITFIDAVGADGEKKKIRRVVNLFHKRQTEKIV